MNDIDLKGSGLRLVPGSAGELVREMPSFRSDDSGSLSASAVTGMPESAGVSVSGQPEENRQVPVDDAVSHLNDYVQSVQRDLEFEVDRDLGQTVVRVIDRETGEVIRQIPDEIALKLADKLHQDEPLTLFSVRV